MTAAPAQPVFNLARAARRRWLLQAAGLAASPWLVSARAAAPEALRIGYQKSSTLTIFLKSRGILEKALAPAQVTVQWHEFTSGLPLLEALNVGAIDLSADVADAVPPFALAAGAQLTYYAIETPSPTAQAIVVKKDSPITSVAQLKGQKVAFAKGAGAHYLLLEALAQQGLSMKDISPAYLNPADGRAAFESGAVAAWVVWDPFLAAVQRQAGARVLVDGTQLSSYRRFYLASTPAHSRHDTRLLPRSTIAPLQRGGERNSNARAIYQFITPDTCPSAQLLMGLTEIAPGNVWNTLPPHRHEQRSEVYFYFGLDDAERLFHIMGTPEETRHIVVKNEEAVICPSWSVHMGAGTSAYTFVWAMGGDNLDYDDMAGVSLAELR